MMVNPGSSTQSRARTVVEAYNILSKLTRSIDRLGADLSLTTGSPICVENCGLCCQHYTPAVTRVEAALIASDLVGSRDAGTRALDWLTSPHTGVGIYGKFRGKPIVSEGAEDLIAEGQQLQESPCPFLNDELRCSIHDLRPVSCHAWGITQVAEAFCKRPLGAGETDGQRAVIGPDALQGILHTIGELIRHCVTSMPELLDVGMLPTLVAMEVHKENLQAEIEADHVPDAALGLGRGVIPWRLSSFLPGPIRFELPAPPTNLVTLDSLRERRERR